MKLQKAKAIAEELKIRLEPGCEKITIAGSIRRQKPEVGDIEILAIPKLFDGRDQLEQEIIDLMFQGILGFRLNKLGRQAYGPKNKLMLHIPSGMGIDIFSTDEECWWVALAIRTGPKESNVAIAMAAQKKGWRLKAYGNGFDTPNGPIPCKSEREVFELVGLNYLEPWERA